jgi:hypothetical protein
MMVAYVIYSYFCHSIKCSGLITLLFKRKGQTLISRASKHVKRNVGAAFLLVETILYSSEELLLETANHEIRKPKAIRKRRKRNQHVSVPCI